jgi:hypothetical protein
MLAISAQVEIIKFMTGAYESFSVSKRLPYSNPAKWILERAANLI